MTNKLNLLCATFIAFALVACETRSGENSPAPANPSKASETSVPLNPTLAAQSRLTTELDKEGSPDTSWHPSRLEYFESQLADLENLDQKIEQDNLAPDQAAQRIHHKSFILTMRHRLELIRQIQKEHADYGDPTLLPTIFTQIQKLGSECAELGTYLGDLNYVIDNQEECYDKQMIPLLDQAEKIAIGQSNADAVGRVEIYRRRVADFKYQAQLYRQRLEIGRKAREIYHY